MIDVNLDAEVDGIDHTNGHGSNVENDDEYDDGSGYESQYDSEDDSDGSSYAGSSQGRSIPLSLLTHRTKLAFRRFMLQTLKDVQARYYSCYLGYR